MTTSVEVKAIHAVMKAAHFAAETHVDQELEGLSLSSGITLKPAIRDHFKTGQRN